jgi:hypothetical protein
MTYIKALELYPNNKEERRKVLNESFKKTIINIKRFIKCNEIDIQKNSMTYVFEHIKDLLINVIALYVPTEDKKYIETKKFDDINYRKKLFELLIELDYKSIMIWIFFHFNYYKLENLNEQRKQLMENFELFYNYLPIQSYFKDINELYQSCYLSNPLFSISYQNRNNRPILEAYCKLLRKICPDLNYNAVKQGRIINSKIKVCFFSEYLTMDSSVLRDRMGIISNLSKTKFDVYYMGFTKKENIKGVLSQTLLKMMPDKYISLPDNIIEARNVIETHNFDIIVYCELGMLMKPLYLSYARLAPLQITTWGHSETSGIDTIDYYVSSKLFDVEEEQSTEHYSEKLHLMNSLSTYYYPPSKILLPPDHVYKSRKDYKLDDNMNIYGCIQSSFKISEDFEKILDGILKEDSNARILMSYSKPYCKSQIQRIINRVGEKDFKRILFLPSLDIINYMNLINLTDVILDPYPFGGCNTSFEAFDLDVPVVTMPTKYLNGRFTFGMYKKMGFIDMVADSPQTYIKLAVKSATDKTWKSMIKEKINKNKHLIFQEKLAITEWSDFLFNTYKKDVLGVF